MSKQINNSPKKSISPEARNRAALLLINTAILTFFYFATQNIGFPILSMIITVGYWIILAVFALAYIIYNRAFSRKNVTVDMLPDIWTAEQKQEYVEDGKRRLEKSKWMLAVIIPFMVTILIDAIYLFTWPMVQGLFGL